MPNVADHLFRQARERGDKTALVFEGRRTSFAQLADQVRVIAGGLKAQGVGPGTRVAVMLPSRPEFILAQYAVLMLGAIFSPLNIFYRRSELLHSVESCDIEILIVAQDYLDRLPDLGAPEMASLKRIFVVGEAPPGEPFTAFAELERGGAVTGPTDLSASAVAFMLNTSATTGKAKGVMLSIANIASNYDLSPGWLGIEENSIIVCALPLYNTFALNQCINATMVTGCTLVLLSRFEPASCIAAIEEWRGSYFPGVPTMLQKLFDHPDAATHDLSSIRTIMTGAAPVPAAMIERIQKTMGPDTIVITGYGLTEGTAILSLKRVELDAKGHVVRPKSMGRVMPGVEVKILRDDGQEAATGDVGEICARGPNVMLGYYKKPEDTAMALSGGWLHTGDLGHFDEDGFLYIVDRKKDIIIRGGQNIYPADIEDVLYRHPGVREVAVIGQHDETLGEVPVAYVAADAGVTEDSLIALCQRELAYYKTPAAIHFLAELPKGPTGKILRRGLREPLQEQDKGAPHVA